MASPSRNPLIDRYYSPLGTVPDFDAYRQDVLDMRQVAIKATQQNLERAERAGRKDEAARLKRTLRELTVE